MSVDLFLFLLILESGITEHLTYVWGDALQEPTALALDGSPYPWDLSAKVASRQLRQSRQFLHDVETESGHTPYHSSQQLLTPEETRSILLQTFDLQRPHKSELLRSKWQGHRKGRGSVTTPQSSPHSSDGNVTKDMAMNNQPDYMKRDESTEGCVPSRLCQSSYNTTAPLFGISLTSGKPVTIVQKFPDLLQQVVFQVCKATECEVLQGECVQTFIPYLFLVLPLGPVSITGQDYVLVESGCTCQPKYAKRHLAPPLPFIQPIN